MAIRSKDDAEQLRERARSMYFSNETVDWFLGSASAAQLRAVMGLLGYELDVRERNKRARLYRRAKFPQVSRSRATISPKSGCQTATRRTT